MSWPIFLPDSYNFLSYLIENEIYGILAQSWSKITNKNHTAETAIPFKGVYPDPAQETCKAEDVSRDCDGPKETWASNETISSIDTFVANVAIFTKENQLAQPIY